jgi:hypothetical protein
MAVITFDTKYFYTKDIGGRMILDSMRLFDTMDELLRHAEHRELATRPTNLRGGVALGEILRKRFRAYEITVGSDSPPSLIKQELIAHVRARHPV